MKEKADITLQLIQKSDSYPSKVVFDKQAEEFQLDKCIDILVAQIFSNIYRRVQKGENQNTYIAALQSLIYVKDGMISPQQEQIIEDLMIEANSQLELIKLPRSFKDNLKEAKQR